MTYINSVSPVSFRSTYLIPFNQMEKAGHESMRKLGADTVKFINGDETRMAQSPEGILVNVDDSKDKEYEAMVAKYGLNIQKYNGDFKSNENMAEAAYRGLVSKLYPDKAEEMTENFKTMDRKAQTAEFGRVYNEFKNSQYSTEYSGKSGAPHITPTGAPILKYQGKDGENYMARPVKLDNGYPCIAVATEKDPSKVMLMNEDEFKKFLLTTAQEIKK